MNSSPWPATGLEYLAGCPVCGSVRSTLLYQNMGDDLFKCAPGEWNIWRCGECASTYLNPRPTINSIALAYKSYPTHNKRDDDDPSEKSLSIRGMKNRVIEKYINMKYGYPNFELLNALGYLIYLKPSLRIGIDSAMRNLPRATKSNKLLDVGCGNGRFMAWARTAGWSCSGTEVDTKSAAIALTRGFDVHIGELAELVAKPERFDVVTVSHVIEHVHNPLALLMTVRQLLKPAGILWLETPNIDSHGHEVFGVDWYALQPPTHLQIFNTFSLISLVRKAGFLQVDIGPWQNDWQTILEGSIALRRERFIEPLRAIHLKNAEQIGRTNCLKREFINITASGISADAE